MRSDTFSGMKASSMTDPNQITNGTFDVIVPEPILDAARHALEGLPVAVEGDAGIRAHTIIRIDRMTPATYVAVKDGLRGLTRAGTTSTTGGDAFENGPFWSIPNGHVGILTDPDHRSDGDFMADLAKDANAITVPSRMIESIRAIVGDADVSVGEDAGNEVGTIRVGRMDATFREIAAILHAIAEMEPGIPFLTLVPSALLDVLTIPSLSPFEVKPVIVQGTMTSRPGMTLAQTLLGLNDDAASRRDDRIPMGDPFDNPFDERVVHGIILKRHVDDMAIERSDLPARGFDHHAANRAPRSQGRERRR